LAGNQLSIKDYNLRYIEEQDLCFKRKRKGKGFIYINGTGKKIRSKKLVQRFESLVIPPAWEDVQICGDENGHIQATGRDSKGRKQYIYHPNWEEFSNLNKFNRMIEFGETLPIIRKRIEKDIKKKSLLRNKVLAVIIRLMEETLIRIGNEIYAEQNKSYGLTTLKDKHIEVNGYTLNFQFNGKGGKPLSVALTDRTLAKITKKCQDLPGQHLFQYLDEDGKRHPVESADVNEYLNSIVEKNFTAKDFRTWGATVAAAEKLNSLPLSGSEKENERNVVKAIKLTADELNNTPAICRKYYVHPDIIESYLDGYLMKEFSKAKKSKSKYGLEKEEKAVLNILKKYSRKRKKRTNSNGKS
jgi:DNA topoisomerase-1